VLHAVLCVLVAALRWRRTVLSLLWAQEMADCIKEEYGRIHNVRVVTFDDRGKAASPVSPEMVTPMMTTAPAGSPTRVSKGDGTASSESDAAVSTTPVAMPV
jgi:hypothetical protein